VLRFPPTQQWALRELRKQNYTEISDRHYSLGAHLNARDRKAALRAKVLGGEEPGLLAYDGPTPVGWVALGPRADYPHLSWSRVLKAPDDLPVISVVCFVVAASHRRRGLTGVLLDGAVDRACGLGAPAVEGYPIVPAGDLSGCDGYTGTLGTFLRRGFEEVARPSARRAVVRLYLDP